MAAKLSYIFFLKLLFAYSLSFNHIWPANGDTSSGFEVGLSGVQQVTLGQGFDSMRRVFKNECVTGRTASSGGGSTRLSTSLFANEKQKLETMTGKISGGINLGLVAGSQSAQLVSKVEANGRNESVTMAALVDLAPDRLLPNAELSPFALRFLKNEARDRARVCGDHYVQEIRRGLRLFVSFVVDYNSQQTFRETVTKKSRSALFGAISSSSTSTDTFQDLKGKARVRIESLQIGGNQSRLKNLLASLKLNCDVSQMKPCIDSFKKLADFAGTPAGKGGFSDVVSDALTTKMNSSEGPSILSAYVTNYESSGLFDFVNQIDVSEVDRIKYNSIFNSLESYASHALQQRDLALSDLELNTQSDFGKIQLAQIWDEKLRQSLAVISVCGSTQSLDLCDKEFQRLK